MGRISKFRTINSIDSMAQPSVVQDYINSNYSVIRLYIGYLDRQRLKHNFVGTLFQSNNEIQTSHRLIESPYCFSTISLKVPFKLDCITDIFLNRNLEQSGIFRVNTLPDTLQSLIYQIEKLENSKEDKLKEMADINERFTAVDIAEAYKAILKSYNPSIIPVDFIHIAMAITEINDLEDKKVCAKALVYGLPSMNRIILENCIYVCLALSKKFESQVNIKQMSLHGISLAIMPNLFRPDEMHSDVNSLRKLSEFVFYLFNEYKYVFSG